MPGEGSTFVLPLLGAKEFIVVEYPAIVVNHHKAIATLGGIDAVNRTFNSRGRKPLALTFRPNVLVAKPAHATRRDCFIVLVKVQQLRHRRTGMTKLCAELVGICRDIYSFDGMFDFQYCPMLTVPSTNPESNSKYNIPSHQASTSNHTEDGVLSYQKVHLLPDDVFDVPLMTYFEEHKDDPIFLLPRYFTRLDQGCALNLGDMPRDGTDAQSSVVTDIAVGNTANKRRIVGKVRRKPRAKFAILRRYDDPVPVDPHPTAMRKLEGWPYLNQIYQALKTAFEECPVMTRRAMAAFVSTVQLDSVRYYKECVSLVAYYLHNGPWKRTWVRLGFDPKDPRNAPIARLYQIVEVKLVTAGFDEFHMQVLNSAIPSSSKKDGADKTMYLYRSHELPYAFDTFYRLCDIHHEPVQQLIASCPLASSCHPEYGWFREGFIAEVRRLLREDIRQTVGKLFQQHSVLPPGGDWAAGINVSGGEESQEEIEDDSVSQTHSVRESLRPRSVVNYLAPDDSVSVTGRLAVTGFDESDLFDSDEDPEYQPTSDSSIDVDNEV